MPNQVFVYSTLTAPNLYVEYAKNPDKSLNRITRKVLIQGGANVANRKTLVTPNGVVTKVSAEDYAWLQDNKMFKFHEKAGYLRVVLVKPDTDEVIKDMVDRSDDSPIKPEDYLAPGYTGSIPQGDVNASDIPKDKGDGAPPPRLSIMDRIRRME